MIFSCGLSYQCLCPHSESQSIPASPGSPPILLGSSLDLLWALWGQVRCWSCLTSMCIRPQSALLPPKPTVSTVGTLVYSCMPQIQGLPSWLRGFNLLLLQLHRDISLSLLWSHGPSCSALILALPLHVGHPQGSVPHPGKRRRKQQLIRPHLLTQAGGREGYSTHNWDMWGVLAAAEVSMKLQEPKACRALS